MIQRTMNATLILILSGVLLGALYIQLFENEEPCPLCLLQRIGMLGVAFGALLNIRFGAKPAHYGIILISALLGASVALRQITLHICPGFPAFGVPVLGLSLYTWSFLVFACSILYTALLLFTHPDEDTPKPCSGLGLVALYTLLFIALLNSALTLLQCGLGPCE